MAAQQAKPQGRREAGPAAPGRRGWPGARGFVGAGGGAARCPGVRSPGPARGPWAGSSEATPPSPLPWLLLGLLLLAALPEHCRADPGTDNLQISVTPTPEPFPHQTLLPISPKWPFSEVKSSSAMDGTEEVLGLTPGNTSWLQLAQTPSPKTHRRTRAPVDVSSSLHRGSGHSTSLEPSKNSSKSLVPSRPQRGEEAVDESGLPSTTSMLSPLSIVPTVMSLSAVLPSQLAPVGGPSISQPYLPSLCPPSSPSLAPDSPHSIILSKTVDRSTKVPSSHQTAPSVSYSSQTVTYSLSPSGDEMNQTLSRNIQESIDIPSPGFPRSFMKQYSELSPTKSPHSGGSPTPGFWSSVAALTPLSSPTLAPGDGLWLPSGPPLLSKSEGASSPVSTQPVKAQVAKSTHSTVHLSTFWSTTVAPETEKSLFQATDSLALGKTSRKLAHTSVNDAGPPPHVSAAQEHFGEPTLSAGHTSSSLVPPLPSKSHGKTTPSVPASPLNLPFMFKVHQPARSRASPSSVPTMPIRDKDNGGSLPTTVIDVYLYSHAPNLPSMTWTRPLQKESGETAVFQENEKTSMKVPLQSLPSKGLSSLYAVQGFASDSSTEPVSSSVITKPGTNLPPSELSAPSLPSVPSIAATKTSSTSPGLSSPESETSADAVNPSGFAASASTQVTAFSSSSGGVESSTVAHVRKPAITDAFWSSLLAERGLPSSGSTVSGLLQQTNDSLNGHTTDSASWETHFTSTPVPLGFTSAAGVINSQNVKELAGQLMTVEGLSVRGQLLGASTRQPIQQPSVTLGESDTDFWLTSSNTQKRDYETAGVEEDPSTSPISLLPVQTARPLLPTLPSLTSPDSLHKMLSDGADPSSQISSSIYPSPGLNASTPLRSGLRAHLTAGSPPVSTSTLFRNPSKALLASQHPKQWTGATTNTVDSSVSSHAAPIAASAATVFVKKSSPLALSAALVAKGAGSSPAAVAAGFSKSSLTTTLAKNVTSKGAPSPKVTPGAFHTPFPFTPTYMFARTAHTVSTHAAMPGNMGSASGLLSTTHFPRKPQAMHTDPPNPTKLELPKASTTRPLTITAALTSITASVKATHLPALLTENTDAALSPMSTEVATTGKIVSNLECQMSSKLLVKTVLFLTQRRMQSGEFLKLSVAKGLTQALRKAFHQSDVSAHVDILEHSHNITVGYYASKGRLVYLPAVVIEMLGVYGISNVTADLKQHTPNLQSVAVLASPWNPEPAGYFQLKTVLQFVSQSDNIHSCKFAQTMEQRLQKAFQDAESKVLNTKSNLAIQIVSTSNASQTVTLVYVVGNQSTFLNGTVASSLLSQLSAELVGFYLTYPPLTIAEPLEYPNLDTSETTRDYWVITVLQGVDNSLVGLHNQSFARVMEQRLAQLFMMSQQQGRRFKRATTLGSYTVQMVKMQRVPGPKDPAELTYYTLYNGKPLLGTAAAKILSTIDSQRMALTLHHVVLLQADPVVKNPPNNLWIIAAVLAPIAVVTVIIIIITAVLCRKNKNDFKPDTMMNLPQRAKPVQGFDYAKQHLGQQGADEEVIPVTQETVVLPLPIRDAPASQERDVVQDGSTIKTAKSTETRKSRSPSENGSVISNESGKPSSGRRSPQNVTAQQKVTKEEARKRNVPASDEEEGVILFDNSGKATADPFDSSSGSVQLIAIKPTALPVAQPAAERSQEPAVLNGEVNKALKQKSDIEHYRNKLRLKAKRKGYYDFPPVEANKGLTERKKMYEKAQKEMDHILDPDPELCAPFTESKTRQQMKNSVYRSRQSLNSPSPGETEMDLLVTRERPRRGIRNSGYDTEPEIIEETNVDRVNEPRAYTRSRQVKGHSETSTLSSQPSIDEVRQQMHMLLEEAFSLASAGHGGQSRHQEAYGSAQHLPYSEVVTSAPGTMTRPRAGVQWVPTYRPEMYQYSLPRPAYRFSQLPEMVMGSPPPPVPPRTGPVAVASLRRSTSDIGSKTRMTDSSGPEPTQLHDSASFAQVSRGPVSVAQLDQSALNYSGNTVPAVFAIPAANRPGFTGYFIPTPPSSYRNQAWMSYAGENELPGQWADSVPLPGYIEAYPRSRYQQNSPSRLPRQYSQPSNLHPSLEQAPAPSTAASQQSLAENDPSDTPLTNISTAALVKAIREEVAKLAKKQTDMFEFQV